MECHSRIITNVTQLAERPRKSGSMGPWADRSRKERRYQAWRMENCSSTDGPMELLSDVMFWFGVGNAGFAHKICIIRIFLSSRPVASARGSC